MKFFLSIFSFLSILSLVLSKAGLEKIDVKILDPSKGKCTVTIHPAPPGGSKTVDVDIESMFEAKDIIVKFGAFSLIDGQYNEFIETDSISICDAPKSDHPLVSFVFKEVAKAGNITSACPIVKGHYYLKNFGIEEEDVPIALPNGNFKVELNGTLHGHDGKDHPIFVADIYFSEK